MSVIQIYLDETSTHDKDGVYRLVGLIGWHHTWEKFNELWKAHLNDYPPTQYWHTTSAHHGRLLVTGTDHPLALGDRRQKEFQLIQLLATRAGRIASLELEMAMSDWKEVVEGQVRLPKKHEKRFRHYVDFLEHPLFVLMREAMRLSLGLARHMNSASAPGTPMQLWSVFEENESEEANQMELVIAGQLFKWSLPKHDRSQVGPVIFLPSKGELGWTPLQIVDLYAWHVNACAAGTQQPEWSFLEKNMARNHRRIGKERLSEILHGINSGAFPEIE